MKKILPLSSPYSALLGSGLGMILFFVFCAATDHSVSGVSLAAKVANALSIAAFMSLGIPMAGALFRIITPSKE